MKQSRPLETSHSDTKALFRANYEQLLEYSDLLCTGRSDIHSRSKLIDEIEEFRDAMVHNDVVGAYTEIADIIYYSAKAVHNTLLSENRMAILVGACCEILDCEPNQAFIVAITKYELRAVINRDKNDNEERIAVRRSLGLN